MPFKDPETRKAYRKKYDHNRTELIHQAKISRGIPIDQRKKPTV